MTIEEFGTQLLTSGDLDPIYIALCNLGLPPEQLRRWLLAYWCFYHAGAASWLCEQKDFWSSMLMAAQNEEPTPFGQRWPRSSERRHFRGRAAIDAVQSYQNSYKHPEEMVDFIVGQGGDFVDLSKRARQHKQFGPWLAFKIGDMAERVLGVEVNFTQASVFMFNDPVEAALIYWRQSAGLPESAKAKNRVAKNQIIDGVVRDLRTKFEKHSAPPAFDRPVDLQEIETILCKWKSHLNGHYPVDNDIIEIRDGLNDWVGVSSTAAKFLDCMPESRHWGQSNGGDSK